MAAPTTPILHEGAGECPGPFRPRRPLAVGVDAHGCLLYRDAQDRARTTLEELHGRFH